MPINPLVRSVTHFQGLKDRNQKMKAVDFDDQFALIADYLNTSVVPVINQLIAQKVPGSTNPADINKFFRNVGDGTVEWASIGNDAIQDYTLELRKLSRSNPGTILAAGANRAFSDVTPNAEGDVLISQAGALPVWQKLRAINVEDRQITSEKIALATLTNDNFQNGILTTQLLDNSVTAEKITNKTLLTNKFQDGVIDENIMGVDLLSIFTGNQNPNTNQQRLYLWGNVLPDNFITDRQTFSFGYETFFGPNKINSTHLAPNFKISANKFTLNNLFSGGEDMRYFADQIIASYQIADNSLNASYRLVHTPSSSLSRNINDLIADGAIQPQHLPPVYRAVLGL